MESCMLLATVVGVLIEVPVMLSVVFMVKRRGVSVRRATLALFAQEAHHLMPACFGIGADLFEDGL